MDPGHTFSAETAHLGVSFEGLRRLRGFLWDQRIQSNPIHQQWVFHLLVYSFRQKHQRYQDYFHTWELECQKFLGNKFALAYGSEFPWKVLLQFSAQAESFDLKIDLPSSLQAQFHWVAAEQQHGRRHWFLQKLQSLPQVLVSNKRPRASLHWSAVLKLIAELHHTLLSNYSAIYPLDCRHAFRLYNWQHGFCLYYELECDANKSVWWCLAQNQMHSTDQLQVEIELGLNHCRLESTRHHGVKLWTPWHSIHPQRIGHLICFGAAPSLLGQPRRMKT